MTWDGFAEKMSKSDKEILRSFGQTDAARKMKKDIDELFFKHVLFKGQSSQEFRAGFLTVRQRLDILLNPTEDDAKVPEDDTTSMDGI